MYRPPPASAQHCYAQGWLVVPHASHIDWVQRNFQHFTDATGETDLGNFDYFIRTNDYWLIGGDWGEVHVYTPSNPHLTFAD